MRVVTAEEMRGVEAASGLSTTRLVDRAAAAIAAHLMAHVDKKRLVAVFAGGGNNGSDGFAVAKMLHENDHAVGVLRVGECTSDENRRRQREAAEAGVEIAAYSAERTLAPETVILDCIFGFGLSRPASGEFLTAIRSINNSDSYVYSVDIPSGLSADEGCLDGAEAVRADETLTLAAYKQGLLIYGGRDHTGKVTVLDIGLDLSGAKGRVSGELDAALPPRNIDSHKGGYGDIKIIGGSGEMPGAPLLCAEAGLAALRAGAGRVTLCCPKSLRSAYQSRVKQLMLMPLADIDGSIGFDPAALDRIVETADTVVLGMGMGKRAHTREILAYLLSRFRGVLVVDADALRVIDGPDMLCGSACRVILTPHIGEARQLMGIARPLPQHAAAYAQRTGAVVVLKSATTVITDGDAVWYNTTGTPALAKGGSGDMLAGMIAAMCGVLPPLNAAVAACYHFGKAAERARTRLNSEASVVADDVIIEIGSQIESQKA